MDQSSHDQFSTVERQLRSWFVSALDGDRHAYSKFLLKLTPYLRGFFRKRMQALPDLVEDLTQEVLLAIHVKRHTYDVNLPISAWIHAIAKYKYVDLIRSRKYLNQHESIDEDSEVFATSDEVSNNSHRDLEKLLQSLPESSRVAIQLTKLAGYSVKEASEITGMSESAVKIGVHRGLRKLASALGYKYEH